VTSSIASIARAAGVAAAATTAQHILLYDKPIKEEDRYALGVTTIAAAFALWASHHEQWEALGALVIIAAAAGLPVIVGYRVRRERSQERISLSLVRRGLGHGRAAG
jgi:hypothetical protein